MFYANFKSMSACFGNYLNTRDTVSSSLKEIVCNTNTSNSKDLSKNFSKDSLTFSGWSYKISPSTFLVFSSNIGKSLSINLRNSESPSCNCSSMHTLPLMLRGRVGKQTKKLGTMYQGRTFFSVSLILSELTSRSTV